MEIFRTLNFLKSARVAVIASEDDKIFRNFINYISGYSCAELPIMGMVQYDCANHSKELKIAIANVIKDLKEKNTQCVLPIEFLHLGEHLVTALLRSIFFRIPENDKPDIQMFKLHHFADELRLECEFGDIAGLYIVYDYDAVSGKFTEKKF